MEVEIGDWRHLEFNDATFVHLAFSRSRVEASLETGRDRPAMQSINQHGCNKFIQLACFKHVFFDLVILFLGMEPKVAILDRGCLLADSHRPRLHHLHSGSVPATRWYWDGSRCSRSVSSEKGVKGVSKHTELTRLLWVMTHDMKFLHQITVTHMDTKKGEQQHNCVLLVTCTKDLKKQKT